MSTPIVPPALRSFSLFRRDAELVQHTARFDAGFREMARRRLVDAVRAAFAERHLHGAIAVGLGGFDLGYAVVRHIDHGHRNGVAIVGENTGHADLAANQS